MKSDMYKNIYVYKKRSLLNIIDFIIKLIIIKHLILITKFFNKKIMLYLITKSFFVHQVLKSSILSVFFVVQ